jgi:hypothetical protein
MNIVSIHGSMSLRALLLIFSVLFVSWRAEAQTDPKAQIKSAFNGYREALITRDHTKALLYLDRNTLKYYDSLLLLVRFADSAELATHGKLSQMLVLSIRVLVPVSEIRVMNGKTLLEYAFRHGWVGTAGTDASEIDTIHVQGDEALAAMTTQGRPAGNMRFVREGNWRIDLVFLMRNAERALNDMLEQTRTPGDVFLRRALERSLGGAVPAGIWSPVG